MTLITLIYTDSLFSVMNLTSAEYSRVFKLLDKYARSGHRSFLAEFFLSEPKAEYVLCFRPMNPSVGCPNECRYLRFETAELRAACKGKVLTDFLVETLETELSTLGRSV